MKHPAYRLIPLVLMLALVLAVGQGLFNQESTTEIKESRMIGMGVSEFEAPILGAEPGKMLTPDNWANQIVVLNIFASWCEPCVADHAQMMKLAQMSKVNVLGIAWKDEPEKTLAFLQKHGNPYQLIGMDTQGKTSIPLGLTGVPETFLINRSGVIVYNYKSFMTDEEMNNGLLPKLNQLLQEQNAASAPTP